MSRLGQPLYVRVLTITKACLGNGIVQGRWLVLSACLLLISIGASKAEITLTDIAGREVIIAAPAKRILLAESWHYPALAILDKDAARRVIGIGGNPGDLLPETVRDLSDKPRLGSVWGRTFSIEKALELKPDLMIADAGFGGLPPEITAAFAKIGVPIVYVDFRDDPVKNTPASIKITGRAIGAEQKAAEFLDFYHHHIERITDRLKMPGLARPRLLIMARGSGGRCCFATPDSGVTAYFGGLGFTNIANAMVRSSGSGPVQLSLEYIVASDPEIFVAKAVTQGPDSLFGQPRSLTQGVASLEKLRLEPGLRDLSAVRSGRVHAIDLSLMVSPLNFVVFEALAKWVHPELFADIDPQATLDEINRRFLKTPLKGPFWVSLDPTADKSSGKRP